MQGPDMRNERGIALVVAIVALVVIGAIISGTFFISRVERQTTTNTVQASQAFQAAEAGVQRTVANWDIAWNTMALGARTGPIIDTMYTGIYVNREVMKLNERLFLVMSTGSQYGAAQSLGALLHLVPTAVDAQAAVTAGGDVRIGGSATVRGEDTPPALWTCDPAGPTRIGIRSSGDVSTTGSSYQLSGNPDSVVNDPTVTDDLFREPFEELRERATLTLNGGSYNGMAPTVSGLPARCDRTNPRNWGEPWRLPAGGTVIECVGYVPIILHQGNLRVQDGRGQGILLVDGNLDIRGNFEFTGLVIVLGAANTNGTGNKITGAVLANQANLDPESSFLGNPTVAFSNCALQYVLQANALARPVAGRAFANVYN